MARSKGSPAARGWRRLGHLVAAERGRRRWTVAELAQRAGLSYRTIEYIEGGARDRYRDSTLGKLEDAFRWPPGTVVRIIDGGEPRQSSDALFERVATLWPALSADQRQAIVDLLETFVRQR